MACFLGEAQRFCFASQLFIFQISEEGVSTAASAPVPAAERDGVLPRSGRSSGAGSRLISRRHSRSWQVGKMMRVGCSVYSLSACLDVQSSLVYLKHLSLLPKSWGPHFHSKGACEEPPSLSLWPSYLFSPSLSTQISAVRTKSLQSSPLHRIIATDST